MNRRHLAIILLLAALLRLGLFAAAWKRPHRVFTPDSTEYVELARSLAGENAFRRAGQNEIFRTPGYPLFLIPSMVFRMSYWRAAIVAQILLDVLLVYLTFLLASMLAGHRAGMWAALFQAVSTAAIVSSVRILSDSLFALLLTLAVCMMVLHFRSSRWWPLVAAACVLAAACYVRPVGIVMAGVFAVVLLFRPNRLRRAGAFVGIIVAALAPWVVRNHVSAKYTGFSSFAGDSMFLFAAPELISHVEDSDAAALRARFKEEARPLPDERGFLPPPGPAAVERRRKAIRIISQHPGTYAYLHLRGCLGMYLPSAPGVLETAGITERGRGASDVLRRRGLPAAARHYFGDNVAGMLLAAPMVLLLGLKYLAAGVCAVRKLRPRMPAEAWLVAAVVVVATLLPGPFGLPRYRVPIEPLLSAAAAVGLTVVIDAAGRRRRRTAARAGARPAAGG